jgi:hypothetical protein
MDVDDNTSMADDLDEGYNAQAKAERNKRLRDDRHMALAIARHEAIVDSTLGKRPADDQRYDLAPFLFTHTHPYLYVHSVMLQTLAMSRLRLWTDAAG